MQEQQTLGKLIGALRRRSGWTLKQMSDKIGIPLSTLAKVETDKLSLTYDKLQQVAARLGLTMAEFLSAPGDGGVDSAMITGRRSITGASNSVRVLTANYDYEYLCTDLRQKRMVPILTRLRAHDTSEFGDAVRHKGEEFVFVLEGKIEVNLEFYAPVMLSPGEGVYLDSTMGHSYTLKDCDEALVLGICSSEDPDLETTLIGMAEAEKSAPGTSAVSKTPKPR